MIGGRVLDVSAIRDIARGGSVYGRALVGTAVQEMIPLVVPAAALQEVWAVTDPADHPFVDLLLALPVTVVDALDSGAAQASGELAAAGTGRFDAAAAHTVHVAHRRGLPVVTADPGPLRALDDAVAFDLLPDA